MMAGIGIKPSSDEREAKTRLTTGGQWHGLGPRPITRNSSKEPYGCRTDDPRNMSGSERYEDYPVWMVALSNAFSLSIYAIGAYVLWTLAPFAALLYLAYCGILEIRVLRHSCPGCYYYGRTCCFGKGRLCPLLFGKGDPDAFIGKKVSWYNILPDFLVTIIPIIGGAVLLAFDFSLIIAALLLVLLILGFAGSAFIRGSYACKHCRQRDLGCPALSLFEKNRPDIRNRPG